MKKSNKYNYIDGKQITDPDTGKRVYEISSYRLPSVTTILGATKNTEFLTKWKAKVGEQEADRIKNVSSARGTSMHKFLESYVTGVGYDDLTELGCQAALPMANKIMEIGLAPVEEYYGSEVTLHYPGLYAGQTDLICNHNGMETVVDFKQANRPKKKNGSKIIICKLQHTPWHTTMSTAPKLNKELSWYARLTYITKNLK
jgi:hypothetical protein